MRHKRFKKEKGKKRNYSYKNINVPSRSSNNHKQNKIENIKHYKEEDLGRYIFKNKKTPSINFKSLISLCTRCYYRWSPKPEN